MYKPASYKYTLNTKHKILERYRSSPKRTSRSSTGSAALSDPSSSSRATDLRLPSPMPRRSMPPSSPSSDPRSNTRKKKRKQQRDSESDSDSAAGAAGGAASPSAGVGGMDAMLDLRESEVVSGSAQKISDFPVAYKRVVNRPHHSVLSIVAAERRYSGSSFGSGSGGNMLFMENVSHGQLQSTSAVASENLIDGDKPPLYVCTPPVLMDGKGVSKKFEGDCSITVPSHSDWFSPTTVHRIERQVVPHFFSGKSPSHTPEKYMSLRNKIITKYLENPMRRLAFGECQSLVANNNELYDLSRMVRFLDNWGIINYFATGSVHRGLRMAAPLLREESNTGELQLVTAPLKSIDSLMLFDRPKCSMKTDELASVGSGSGSGSNGLLDMDDNGFEELDGRIMEKLTDITCSYCSIPLPGSHYQSQKEAEVALCSNCFSDGKYIHGHCSLDYILTDSKKDASENSENWTDQETFLLLEGIEKYGDNWREVAEHVGTKSKAQCTEHFIRLPVEEGLLENFDVPQIPLDKEPSKLSLESNGTPKQDIHAEIKFPFADAPNPVMSLVAFLTSAIGPRVAAACANAALCILTKEDSNERVDGTPSPLSREGVKHAAVCGLSAAAMKAKLFADQEEREIQRLSATIINHQLKRLELKLKKFAEIETLLLKECEQTDNGRQHISASRARMMSGQVVGPVAPSTSSSSMPMPMPMPMSVPMQMPMPPSSTASIPLNPNPNANPRPPATMQPMNSMNSPIGNMPAGMQQFMQRQQQMLSFGPRLPLSAIHPNLNAGPAQQNVGGFNPLLRPSSSNNSHVG